MHLSISTWKRVEAGQRPGIQQRKSARGGNFDYHQVPPVGTFYVFDPGTDFFIVVIVSIFFSEFELLRRVLLLVNDSSFNPLSLNVHIWILHTDFHTFL